MKQIPQSVPPIGRVTRPWGAFRQFAHNSEVTVSLMSVREGQRLSLQSHRGRAELWIVLDPGAVIQVNDEIMRPDVGSEIWIPAGARHRLAAEGRPVRVLEVAFGDWQQDDITRYDDDYHRPAEGER